MSNSHTLVSAYRSSPAPALRRNILFGSFPQRPAIPVPPASLTCCEQWLTWVPLPPKLSLKRTACPVAASYSAAKRCVMRSYALRVTANDTSVRLTVGSFLGASRGFLLSSFPTCTGMRWLSKYC